MHTDTLRPVALLTDFGLSDPYAGQLRAVLARLAPGVTLLDVSHSVEPFAVSQAAFFLAASARYFPPDAVFLCVVDPGVGSSRRIVGASVGGQDFLAPDNGLLGLLLSTPGLEEPPRVFDLTCEVSRYASSATFHGRDIIAPMAARLAAGESLSDFGRQIDPAGLVRPDWAEPAVRKDGVEAHVLHVDRYGNCLLSVRKDFPMPAPVRTLRLPWGQRRPVTPVRIYSDLPPDAVGLLAGSQGFLELAVNQASGATALGLRRGDQLRLIWAE